MTAVTDPAQAGPAPDGMPENAAADSRRRARLGKEDLGLLVGLPLLCLVVMGGWVLWRMNADLDAIEARALDWSGLWTMTVEHLQITAVATVIVLITAIPVGILLTRPTLRRFAAPVTAVANAGQAAPVIGIVVLLAIWVGFGFWTAVASFSIYAFLPVLRNTIVGLQGVDSTLVEAARGMGMSTLGVLFRVELPLALPVILVGARTALVLVVGTASFATFVSAGGLGTLVVTGITLFRGSILVSGGLIIAVLALLVDWAGRVIELVLTPKGM